jgi:hypothetical protein
VYLEFPEYVKMLIWCVSANARFCPRCELCKEVVTEFVLKALGKSWHMAHFMCSGCKDPIGEQPFFERESAFAIICACHDAEERSCTEADVPFCTTCYYSKFGAACAKCKEMIIGSYIESDGTRWHPQCHTCHACGQLIHDDCLEAIGALFHPACFCCDVRWAAMTVAGGGGRHSYMFVHAAGLQDAVHNSVVL